MILPLILFFIATVIFTYPLIINLTNTLPGSITGDGFMYLWNAYIFWHQLVENRGLFFTNMVFYPIGVNLAFHDYSPPTSLLLGVFKNDLVLGLNILILSSFTFSCFSMYILMKWLTKNLQLSWVAGLVYGLSPVMFSFLSTEHYYYLFSSIYLPLGVLFSLMFFEEGKKLYLFLLILMFWLLFFTTYYMGVMYVVIVGIIFLVKSWDLYNAGRLGFSFKNIKHFMLYIFALTILPLLLLFMFVFNISDYKSFGASESLSSSSCNANLLGYLIPNKDVPYLNNISQSLSTNLGYQFKDDTPSYYVGFIYFCLALVAALLLRRNSTVTSVSFLGIIIFLLSFGTKIQIGAITILDGGLTPFYWFSKLPFLGFIGCPIRFSVIILLVVIVLSYILINEIIKRYKLSNQTICILLVLLFILEFGLPKIEFSSAIIPRVYQKLSQYPDKRTVLELPSGLTESRGSFGYDYSIAGLHGMQMYWQTVYQKPRVGGFVSRIPQTTYQFFKETAVISDIFKLTSYDSMPVYVSYTKEERINFIKKFNIGYIIFSPNPRQTEYLSLTEELLNGFNFEKITQDGFVLLVIH